MIQTILLVNAVVLGVLCTVGAALALLRRMRFEQERTAARAGTLPGEVAYRRYVGSDPIARVRVGLLAAGALLWLGSLVILTPPDITAPLVAASLFPALPLLVLPLAVYQVLVAALADAPAMTQLRGQPTGAVDLVVLFLKANVTALSVYMLLELSALLCMVGAPPIACIVLAAVIYLAVVTVRQRTRIALQRWLFPCTPLEESPYAALAPRVQAWAQRASVEVAAVYVRDTARLGSRESCVVVQDRRCALFITESFLANSEWRQQDALLCQLLAAGARMPRLQTQARQRCVRILAPAIGTLLVDLMLASGVFGYSFVVAVLINLMPVIYIAGVLVLGWRYFKANVQTTKQIVLDADQAAAELTGDPIAVMAALQTEATLAGIPLDHRRLLCPSAAERLEALDVLAAREGRWGWAPWATDPVPSIAPMESEGRLLTTPLTDAAKLATSPEIPEAANPVAVAADQPSAPSQGAAQYPADSKWGG